MTTAQKFDEPFAHFTTKIENSAKIAGTDQRAHFNCCLLDFRDLQSAHLSVPVRIVFDEPLQFLAQFANGRLVIEVQNYRAKQIGRNATPVLKRLFDK
jgi:hypothetical protein